MLARSGKVSMATKKRSGEEINDRQILCGMGIKLRRLTAGICLITQLAFPMAAAAQGVAATVKDPSNHPVAGITVNFTMPQDVAANFTLENNGIAITQANGEAHVTLKGKKAGTHTVTATLGNNNTSDSQPVTFVADKTSAQVVLQMSKDEITGNGVDNATLTATVKDQFDNEVNNLPVTFSSASSGLTLTPGVSNTNESGIAQATLAGVAFGEKTVTASLANNGASDNKTVHFIGDTAAAKIIE